MTVGVSEQITVQISRGVAETTVKAKLQGRGVPQVEEVKVGTFMRARLYGNGFVVSSKSDEGQVIPDNGFAEWVYDVTPLEAGTKSITLQISLRYKLPGSEELTNLPVMTRDISVQVNPWWTAKNFMASNWQWFLGGLGSLMMTIGGFFGKRWLEARHGKTPNTAEQARVRPYREPAGQSDVTRPTAGAASDQPGPSPCEFRNAVAAKPQFRSGPTWRSPDPAGPGRCASP